MATYVLIPGAGSDSWYWHLVVPRLEAAGHRVIAVDLPWTDPSADFAAHADGVVRDVEAAGVDLADDDLVVVAQSLGGFPAADVCRRLPVRLAVLVAAMVPSAGESAGEWWDATGWAEARATVFAEFGRSPDAPFDPTFDFFHDVPEEVIAEAFSREATEPADAVFEHPLPGGGWPEVPTRFVLGRNDRFFPAPFLRRVVEQRLGITPDEIDSGHLPALSRPAELAEMLAGYVAELH